MTVSNSSNLQAQLGVVDNIQILRFFAAFWVAFYHAGAHVLNPGWSGIILLVQNTGFVGVDIFFAISGAIMYRSTQSVRPGLHSTERFIAIRFARIYTGWWIFFVIYLIEGRIHHVLGDKWLLESFLLLPIDMRHSVLSISWTLSFELYFYVIIGLTLLLPFKPRIRLMIMCSIITAVVVGVWYVGGLYFPDRAGERNLIHGFFLNPLILEFIFGYLLCAWVCSGKTNFPIWVWPAIAMLFGSIGMVYHHTALLHPGGLEGFSHGPERVLFFGGMACALVGWALASTTPPPSPIISTLKQFGDASYAIYLGHPMVMVVFRVIYYKLGEPKILVIPGYVLMLITVCVYGWFHYKFVEKPIYLWTRRYINSRLPVTGT